MDYKSVTLWAIQENAEILDLTLTLSFLEDLTNVFLTQGLGCVLYFLIMQDAEVQPR